MGKILSADDSMMMRKIISGAASALGYDVVEAADGAEAMRLIEANVGDLDLIVLDVNMPEMTGFEVLDALKGDDRFKSIPVMMVTTESERVNIVRAIKAGAANYVCKPFTQEELTTKMVESLGQGLGF